MPWLAASTLEPQNRTIIPSVKLCSRVDICSNDAYISIGNPTKIMHAWQCSTVHTKDKRRAFYGALIAHFLVILKRRAAKAAIVALLRPQQSLAEAKRKQQKPFFY